MVQERRDRRLILATSALGFVVAGAFAAPAPAPAVKTAAPRAVSVMGEPVELKTVDGWTLHAAWKAAQSGKATVVLLHGTGQRKEDWRLLLGPLTARGFGVFSVDLRAHGESRISPSGEEVTWHKLKDTPKGPNDFEDMTRDVEAAVGYLGEHGVPEESIGLIGAEVGSSIAAKYAAVHPRVAFLGMLSPGLAWREVTTVNAIRAFSGRAIPILMVHSDKDKVSGPATPLLYAFAKRAVGDKHAGLIVVPEERGTKMLKVNIGLAEKIAAWAENPATALPVDASTAPAAAVGTPETTKGAILIDGNGVHEAPSGDSGRR